MAKEVSKVVKLQVRGGAANPSPPVGPALELLVLTLWSSVNSLCKNARQTSKILPVVITVSKINHLIFL